jgi:phosphoserine phosphatase
MNTHRRKFLAAAAGLAAGAKLKAQAPSTPAPLSSWAEGPVKKALLDFVAKTTSRASRDFIPPAERVAVFDNDGCLWCEQPMYTQLFFVIDRVKALAAMKPELTEKEPFASLLKGDLKGVIESGEAGIAQLVMATHAGMTTEEFAQSVSDWIAVAKHPKTGRPFTEMVYQPMLEVLAHLRANEYKTFIVSGGGVEFMRPWTEKVYGIPPEQVVGSTGGLKFEIRDGTPVIEKLPALVLNDDKAGKPVGIQRHIGRRPVMAFGNSDGDYEMLRWTTAGAGPRFGLIVHHTDSRREFAYDRDSKIGRLDKALNEAGTHGWLVADMARDWARVFPFGKETRRNDLRSEFSID